MLQVTDVERGKGKKKCILLIETTKKHFFLQPSKSVTC